MLYVEPADVLIDMLGVGKLRKILLQYYERCGEQELVREAVYAAHSKELHIYREEVDSAHGYFARFKQPR